MNFMKSVAFKNLFKKLLTVTLQQFLRIGKVALAKNLQFKDQHLRWLSFMGQHTTFSKVVSMQVSLSEPLTICSRLKTIQWTYL